MLYRYLFLLAFVVVVCRACEIDLGWAGSTECSQDALFCTHPSVAATKLACRQCQVNPVGPLPDMSVYDPRNLCNCLPGEFCRQTGPNASLGVCEPSTLVGKDCTTDEDCEGVREEAVQGFSRRERGFCVQGKCAQCNPATFARDWNSMTHTCHGYGLNGDGNRAYHNARPGTQITCLSNGTLVSEGEIDWALQHVNNEIPSSTSSDNNAFDDDNKGVGDNKEGSREDAAILSFMLVAVCCLSGMCILMISVLVLLVRRRASSPSAKSSPVEPGLYVNTE